MYTKIATTDIALKLFDKSKEEYGLPREVLSDRRPQFYGARGGESYYKKYLESLGIKVIYFSVKKPTTTGKIERFWLTHNNEIDNFNSLLDFINYYNYRRPHMSLNYSTPFEVFTRDLKV